MHLMKSKTVQWPMRLRLKIIFYISVRKLLNSFFFFGKQIIALLCNLLYIFPISQPQPSWPNTFLLYSSSTNDILSTFFLLSLKSSLKVNYGIDQASLCGSHFKTCYFVCNIGQWQTLTYTTRLLSIT